MRLTPYCALRCGRYTPSSIKEAEMAAKGVTYVNPPSAPPVQGMYHVWFRAL